MKFSSKQPKLFDEDQAFKKACMRLGAEEAVLDLLDFMKSISDVDDASVLVHGWARTYLESIRSPHQTSLE